jgi:anti-sigma factor (TIGR02949 family)
MSAIDRFTCEDVFRRLDDFVDRELSSREMELAREHIEVCAECAQEYDFSALTLTTIKTKLRRIEVAPQLVERIALALAEARDRDDKT